MTVAASKPRHAGRAITVWTDRAGRELVVLGGAGEPFTELERAIRARFGDDVVRVVCRALQCVNCGRVFEPHRTDATRCESCRRRRTRSTEPPS